MVKVPLTATFPAAEPEIIPTKALKITVVLAVAAIKPFVKAVDKSCKKSPAPNSFKNAP